MGKKPSLLRYYRLELKWAWTTSLGWLRLLRRDRKLAMTQLREGLKSEEFRQRTRGWNRNTSFAYGKLRVTAPLMVGLATSLFCILSQSTVVASIAYGLSAGLITHFTLLVLPFALLVSVPILALFFLRAVFPANVPEPPSDVMQVIESPRKGDAADKNAQPGLDLIAKANQLSPNGEMLAQFDGSDRPLLLRILESDGSVVVRDPEDLERISSWVKFVRNEHRSLTTRQKQIDTLARLNNYVDAKALFELGLLDRDSFRPIPSEFELETEDERLRAIEQRMQDRLAGLSNGTEGSKLLENDFVDPTDTEPRLRPGQMRLISPRGSGFLIKSLADLQRMPSPTLTSDACHDIVRTYVENTDDRAMLDRWTLLNETAPDLQTVLLRAGINTGLDLRRIEDQILVGEVKDTTAQQLAHRYATFKRARRQYEDYIAQQQPVARLVRMTLLAAHANLMRAHRAEMAGVDTQDASGQAAGENPYRELTQPKATTKSRAQRREELAKLIQGAVPTEPLDR